MPEKDPLENILSQLSDLLEFVQKNKEKMLLSDEPIPEGVEKELSQIEKDMQRFREISEEAIGDSPPDDKLTPREKRTLERATQLKGELGVLKKEFGAYRTLGLLKKKKSGGKSVKKRLKKFRRLGGREDWKPL